MHRVVRSNLIVGIAHAGYYQECRVPDVFYDNNVPLCPELVPECFELIDRLRSGGPQFTLCRVRPILLDEVEMRGQVQDACVRPDVRGDLDDRRKPMGLYSAPNSERVDP